MTLPDREGALQETGYALDVLGADGIGLVTSYGDRWTGDPAYAPVFEEINRRKSLVYVHPNTPNCCRDLMSMFRDRALTRYDPRRDQPALFRDFLAVPEDTLHFSHAGGTVPMVAARIARQANARKEVASKLPAEYELKKLHYEIAGSASRPAMAALTSFVPTSQILFGSDYPWLPIRTTAGEMPGLGFSAADFRSIGRDNAIGLLARLRT